MRANRLAAELKVFFGWTASLRRLEVGLELDPSRRLGDLRFPETPRSRRLALQEIAWFLEALVEEERDYQRGMLLWLLTAARLAEVCEARSEELSDGVWSISAFRTKNSVEHRIALGPWGWSLMQTDSDWVFPAPKLDGPRSRSCWYKARDRVKERMERLAGRPIERFTPHDFRGTSRSNTKRLKVDFETAEAMPNHVKKGLERTYDTYELEEEKRAWFLTWENEVADIARASGIADTLGVSALRSGSSPTLGYCVRPQAEIQLASPTRSGPWQRLPVLLLFERGVGVVPMGQVHKLRTRRLSDAELLHADFRVRDPENLPGLNPAVPDRTANPTIVGFYDETPPGGRKANPYLPFIRCCHCGKRRHWKGYVIQDDHDQLYIIGAR